MHALFLLLRDRIKYSLHPLISFVTFIMSAYAFFLQCYSEKSDYSSVFNYNFLIRKSPQGLNINVLVN